MNSMNAANGNAFTVNSRIIALRRRADDPESCPKAWRLQIENAATSWRMPTMSRNQPQVLRLSKMT